MNWNSMMAPLVVVVMFASLYTPRGEYLIKHRQVPSYLHYKITNVDEDVFPRDIRINMSLTRVSGTLLYSIDSSMNQLIVTLYHSMDVTLVVELNRQEFGFSLPQLCGCERCQYEIFDLRIMLDDSLDLQCNGGIVMRKGFKRENSLNEAYIIPYQKPNDNNSSNKEAHLWLVNTPQFGQIYPNNDQLVGCIFKVSYRSHEVMFTKVSTNVDHECKPICKGDICNGGRCYETYNDEPVCNCSATFNNGIYCNDTIHHINIRSTSPHLIFDAFKLSWQSSSKNIMSLENENIRIALFRADGVLTLEYKMMMREGSTLRYVLCEQYVANNSYILIGAFYENNFNIAMYDNGIWLYWTLWTGIDLRREIFTSVSLRSGRGNIGMAYKTSSTDLYWRKVTIGTYAILEDEIPSDADLSKNSTPRYRAKITEVATKVPDAPTNPFQWLYVLPVTILSVLLLVAALLYILERKLGRRLCTKKKVSLLLINAISHNQAASTDDRKRHVLANWSSKFEEGVPLTSV